MPEDVTWRDAGTDLTATVSGLENETPYGFEVRALNSAGPGAAAMTTATPVRLEAELFSSAAAEGEALVVGVRRSGGLTFPGHAYIGVTDDAFPGVTATEEGRDDGLGRHRLEFAAGAAEATVTVTVAFDGERRQDRVLSATLDSAELEVDGVRRPYELVTPTLVVPVTEGDAGLSVADARVQGKSSVLALSLDRTRDVAVRVDYATQDGEHVDDRGRRAGAHGGPHAGRCGAGGLRHAQGRLGAGGRGLHTGLGHVDDRGRRAGAMEHGGGAGAAGAARDGRTDARSLRLSNAVSAVIDEGLGWRRIWRDRSRIIIELPKAWLARFGRTASDHAAQAIARRLDAGRAAGDTGDGGGPACGRPVGGRRCCWGLIAAVGRMEAGFGC